MIAVIREYISDTIALIDPGINSHDQVFTSENIPDTILDRTFFIRFNSASPELIDSDIKTNVEVTLELYKNGFNDIIGAHDELFDLALSIQAAVVSKKRIDQTGVLKVAIPSAVNIGPGETNENLIVVSTTFNFTGTYCSDI